jgi:hypothetical protein
MYAITPDQSLLWLAVRRGWGIGQFVPSATTVPAQSAPGRRPMRTKNATSPLLRPQTTHAHPSVG